MIKWQKWENQKKAINQIVWQIGQSLSGIGVGDEK
jgi:hypothetical protein